MRRKFSLLVVLVVIAYLCTFEIGPRFYKFYISNKVKAPFSEKILVVESEIFKDLSLHLDDAELLQNAFILQAITGPLVRFSNQGRYEPYLAKSWVQNGNDWIFEIHKGLHCEDGQAINASSFRASLIRSLRQYAEQDIRQTPFADIKNISSISSSNLEDKVGIFAPQSHQLVFSFEKQVGKDLFEYLGSASFSFLCNGNFNRGIWSPKKFPLSSGPYRILQFNKRENTYILEIRRDWPLISNGANHFSKVFLTKDSGRFDNIDGKIKMTYAFEKSQPRDKTVFEVPRALLSIRSSIETGKFFSKTANRVTLRDAVNSELQALEVPFANYHLANSFFFGQSSGIRPPEAVNLVSTRPTRALLVRGRERGERPEVDFYQEVLFRALDRLGWDYKLTTNAVASLSDFRKQDYDLMFDRSFVDGSLDPEFVRLLFKSSMGPKLPDPNLEISGLLDTFDSGQVSYEEFLSKFNNIIFQSAAIIPLFHRGFVFDFSNSIDVRELSPLMSIIRYEELVFQNEN